MYYIPDPKIFHPAEFFPISFSSQFNSAQLWRLIDGRVVWTAVELRRRFGVVTINNYLWGGTSQYRGFRPAEELVDKPYLMYSGKVKSLLSSFTSQHCFGRAVDMTFRNFSAAEIREDIRKNPKRSEYKYITTIEDNISWFHFDCRNWDVSKSGILFFNP
jgi:hypothetical protein